ncbi:MAG TPA: acyl-CoA dehydrogenase family protein [Dehalococcoidia bacterium]|nr:acyl-CoA dehydrogenase family protein [Dehalococcoidia bacterium]
MEFNFTDEQEQFRQEVRTFIDANWDAPPATLEPDNQEAFDASRVYEKKLAEHGWLTMAWPKEYGGRAADFMEQLIFREESAYSGAPGAGGQGISMVGPCLMVHGTEEQKERFLPPIANAEAVWCQGFSEPGSGSDLASLQTRAVKDGDDYVINGQKIWTSGATHSDWIHILTRTDTDAPKHRGISYFLLDMKTPGIEVRPIIDLAGNHVLNETFFTDVRVPASQMLGEENRGWYVAATLLDFERSGVNYPAQARRVTEDLTTWAKNNHRNGGRVYDQPGVADGLADLALSAEVCRLLSYRVVWMQGQGLIPNYEASAAKMFGTELNQRVANFGINMIGLAGQRIDPEDSDAPLQADLGRMYMTTVPYTIFAGTSEIQRNIIATRGLGLPRQ